LISLSDSYVTRAAVWHYDPIIESNLMQFDWLLANFSRLATALRGATNEVVVSCAQIYQKPVETLIPLPGAKALSGPIRIPAIKKRLRND